ncbi:MAG TPA: 3-deoxy-7-phosphoheptulonate synthase [Candidatus Saccharimonadales bacterium]|nr:3-deoxy-7-phosphoheptulonate synthase [Candidatus Saccharimonadales bacterium]
MIVMSAHASPEQLQAVLTRIQTLGLSAEVNLGTGRTVLGVSGQGTESELEALGLLEGVERVVRVLSDYPLASREFHPEDRIVILPGGIQIGGPGVLVMAGPCAVESRSQLQAAAEAVASQGVRVLRGGAFKPRTSPYAFQGLGVDGLRMLREVADDLGMAVVTEVMAPEDVAVVARHADLLQIGARNMQNYRLLEACARVDKPVLLKRGMSSTLEEWLHAAEYILAGGNLQVALCERGIRTFEPMVRFTLDITSVPVLKRVSSLPVVVDPSHAAGRYEYVRAIGLAAVAAGADGLLVEVHPNPKDALSDGPQSLSPKAFADMMTAAHKVAEAVGRVVT